MMASAAMDQADALLTLRQSIASNQSPILSSSAEDTSPSNSIGIGQATHVHFDTGSAGRWQTFELDSPTRFISNDKSVGLRSVLFAWLNKDAAAPEYISSTQRLNEELAAGSKVQNLVFAERLDLNSWLGGAQDDSEYIQPLVTSATQAADGGGAAAGGVAGRDATASGADAAAVAAAAAAKRQRLADPRLQEIYQGERRISDRNSILRGIKPTDFSHVRKHAAVILARSRSRPGQPGPESNTHTSTALVSNLSKKPSRRPEPIILLSPSASSLLRMSNIKKFLEEGVYVPADSAAAGTSAAGATILHTQRSMPSVDAHRPLRFVLVDTPDQFKPDYWSRLVAVVTTGQAWQFKSYRWPSPPELFSRVLGIYAGWTGEAVPQTVKDWGRAVKVISLDKWNPSKAEAGRWRDREAVENIWTAIEESMRAKGWGRDGAR